MLPKNPTIRSPYATDLFHGYPVTAPNSMAQRRGSKRRDGESSVNAGKADLRQERSAVCANQRSSFLEATMAPFSREASAGSG